ncbi:18671_t:CDS:2, partial [Racocetra fulgida]
MTGRLTPFELVYGDTPRSNCTVINKLFEKDIIDEEEILSTIDIQADSIINLDDDMEENPEYSYYHNDGGNNDDDS